MATFEINKSGLVVPYSAPEPPKPEHPLRKAIRKLLRQLDECELMEFEMTCHGCLFMNGSPTIEAIGKELAECYNDPSAYRISNMSQYIRAFLKAEREAADGR